MRQKTDQMLKNQQIIRHSARFINQNFVIRYEKNDVSSLVSYDMLLDLLGEYLAIKTICRVLEAGKDEITCKFRKKGVFTFVSK